MLGDQGIDDLVEAAPFEHQVELCSVRPMR